MPINRRVCAMQITLGLAMQAKLEVPDEKTLGLAVIAVGETFPLEDPLRLAVKDFAEHFPTARRTPKLLRQAGDVLFEAVMRASWPTPSRRADIGG